MFSVSNIAWSAEEDAESFALLREFGITHLEVAPGRVWPRMGDTALAEVGEGMRSIRQAALDVSGFQAILFGKADLLLFQETTREQLLQYLKQLAGICAKAGGQYLVFGAPRNRWIPPELNQDVAFEIAADFFRDLGSHAAEHGVFFGLEANPEVYGCNFGTNVEQIARLVRTVNSSGVRWHADTGEFAMNAECLPGVLVENADILGSMHVSQPGLEDFSTPWSGHAETAATLRAIGYEGFISLEMKRPASSIQGVREAIEFFCGTYSR